MARETIADGSMAMTQEKTKRHLFHSLDQPRGPGTTFRLSFITSHAEETGGAVIDSPVACLEQQRGSWVFKYFDHEDLMKARACHWDPIAKRIKSDNESMLAQLAQGDPQFEMIEIDNIEMVDDSNPAGEAAQNNFLASIDSVSVMQRGLNAEPTEEYTQDNSATTPNLATRQAGISQQHDNYFKHPPEERRA
jgi:hypothetical protein